MRNPRTDAQMRVRYTFRCIANQWQKLPQQEMKAYNQYANDHKNTRIGNLTGFQCFVRLNMKYHEVNENKSDFIKPPSRDYLFPIITGVEDIILPREKPLLKIKIKTMEAKPIDEQSLKVYVMASSQQSPGRIVPNRKCNFLTVKEFKVNELGECEIDVTKEYKEKFGILGEYVKVFFKVCLVNKLTGESDLMQEMTMRTKHSSEQ